MVLLMIWETEKVLVSLPAWRFQVPSCAQGQMIPCLYKAEIYNYYKKIFDQIQV